MFFWWIPCPQNMFFWWIPCPQNIIFFFLFFLSFVWRPCPQDVGILCEDPVHKTLVFCVKTLFTRRWCFVWRPCSQDVGISHLTAVVWEARCTLTLLCFVPSTGWWRTHGERSQPRLQRILWSTHCEYKVYMYLYSLSTPLWYWSNANESHLFVFVVCQPPAVCVCCVPASCSRTNNSPVCFLPMSLYC